MKIHVPDIPDDGLLREADLPLKINDHEKPDVAHVSLGISKIGNRVLVEGSVKMTTVLKCGRCLKEFTLPLDLNFREEYLPAEGPGAEGEQELTRKELDLSYYSNDELDLTEIVKEQILLAVPMKPLCSEKCQGLCPSCGKDLNQGACGCSREEIDPRLAPLARFKELLKDRKE